MTSPDEGRVYDCEDAFSPPRPGVFAVTFTHLDGNLKYLFGTLEDIGGRRAERWFGDLQADGAELELALGNQMPATFVGYASHIYELRDLTLGEEL